METTVDQQVLALEEGRAFFVHEDLRLTRASGADARGWLHDLVTAHVASLAPHQVRRTLLLTPKGRVRADLHVLGLPDGSVLLAQRADQPEDVREVLTSYVLSSDVLLERSELLIVSVPSDDPAQEAWTPSLIGEGSDLLLRGPADAVEAAVMDVPVRASSEAVERRRILRGEARFGADLGPDSLPAEAGLEHLIDFGKGCFLGQESVAKVRNLGHPPRVLLHLRCDVGPVVAGEPVLTAGRKVGEITSATPDPRAGGWVSLARVRREAAAAPVVLEDGRPLSPIP
ncbi:MAG: hypothetical protein HY240_11365 [Actinobacteria bacterium]|nr:hypothetical protein [Actinomycetota bacterium]